MEWYDKDWNFNKMSCDKAQYYEAEDDDGCEELCDYIDCYKGQYCYEYECLNTCGSRECTRSYYNDAWDYFEEDCSVRDEEASCEMFCTYEDCSDTVDGAQCWIETCDDLCGTYNCSIWIKEDGEWYGQYCPEDFSDQSDELPRAQDVINAAAMTGEMFDDTFVAALDLFCPNGDCIGVNVTEIQEMDFE